MIEKTNREWAEFCRPYVYMNGSHEMPNYAAICKAVLALKSAPEETPPAAGAIDAREQEAASSEGRWIEQAQHLNCPVCGGSGHVDDVAPNGDAARRALLELVILKEMKDRWEAHELSGFAYKSTDNHRVHNEQRADYLRRQPAAWDAARKALASRQEAPAAAGAIEGGADTLNDAAIVCERRDEFGHTHRGTAAALREVDTRIRRLLTDAVTGDAPSGFALVPLEAVQDLRAAIESREQEQRARLNARFANRPRSAATADFDLPAPNDAVEAPAAAGAALAVTDRQAAHQQGYEQGWHDRACDSQHAYLSAAPAPETVVAESHRRFGPLVKAAINLIAEVQRNHDTKDSPHKYAVPYGAVVMLRDALDGTQTAQPIEREDGK